MTATTSEQARRLGAAPDAALLDPKAGKQAAGAQMTLVQSQVDWQGLLLLDRDGTKVPALKDVRVRQAIAAALDRNAIMQAAVGDYGRVLGTIPAAMPADDKVKAPTAGKNPHFMTLLLY